MGNKRHSTRLSSASTKSSSTTEKGVGEEVLPSAPASPVPQRLCIQTRKQSRVPTEEEETRPVMKLKLNLASIPTNYVDSIQVSSLTETSPPPSSPAKGTTPEPIKVESPPKPEEIPAFIIPEMPVKRKVGRPTKAEALARSLAKAKAEGRGDIGTKLRINLKRRDEPPVLTAPQDHPTTIEHRPKRTKRQDQSYHPEKRKYHKKTPEERAAIIAKRQEEALQGIIRRRRGRPTREEARLRAQEREQKQRTQLTSVAMQDLVDHAWDAEIAAIKDGAPYGTSPQDHLLPNILIFWEPSPEGVSHQQELKAELRAAIERFNRITVSQDSRMGQLELAILDQRLCLEEEKFLLSKLQKLARSRQSGTVSPSTTVS